MIPLVRAAFFCACMVALVKVNKAQNGFCLVLENCGNLVLKP